MARPAVARTSNGNDLALYVSEARTAAEERALVDDAMGRPHAFRYLQVMEMTTVTTNGVDGVTIRAFEPASCMDVCFTVTKPVSLRILREDPPTKPGLAIAVNGKVKAVDKAANRIDLDPVVIRHKDRLSPTRGKELICEVDPRATFYSYTGGKRIVQLTYKDRDLLQHKTRVLKQSGKQGWADFLEAELAKRRAARAEEAADAPESVEKTP